MKKIIALLIALMCIAGCSSNSTSVTETTTETTTGAVEDTTETTAESENKDISYYFDNYAYYSWYCDENGFDDGIIYAFGDSNYFTEEGLYVNDVTDCFGIMVKFNDNQLAEYNALAYDDNFEANLTNIVKESETFEIIHFDKFVPSETSLSAYVGKTIGEMDNDDSNIGIATNLDGESAHFVYETDKYIITAATEGTASWQAPSEEINALVISSVEFNGFSSIFLDSLLTK